MLLTSPIFGGFGIPVRLRVGLSLIVALALAPVIESKVGQPPTEMILFLAALGREAAIGIVMGTLLQIISMAATVAGHFIDMQIGFGIMQMLNPVSGYSSTVLASFKAMAAAVIFLLIDGHHLVFRALVASYDFSPALGMAELPGMKQMLMDVMFRLFMLALQMAAPAAAVAFLTDVALAAVARAVPQMNVLVVGFPAKIFVGLSGVILGFPVLLWATKEGLDLTSRAIWFFLRGGLNA